MDTPLRFTPFLRPMVWGGRRLETMLGKPLPTKDPYGESWEISDHPLHRSLVATGPRAGQSIRQLMENEKAPLLGQSAGALNQFPWMVKFLDAHDWLSVQVHPDEAAVRRLWPGEGSKTEAWFVLDAQPGSRIYSGLLPGIDQARLRAALKAGTVAQCLHALDPRPGDCLFLPAGTVHAVGGGVLMAEVQQTSDATFRLFDWNRRDSKGNARELHIEQSIACIDWKRGPVQPVRAAHFEASKGTAPSAAIHRQILVRCRYFIMEYVYAPEEFVSDGQGRLQIAIVLQGRGHLSALDTEEDLRMGQAWLLPAGLTQAKFLPESPLGLLLCTLPGTHT